MARSHARILTSIWSDPDFTRLPALAQRLYVVVLSQPELSVCGVLTWNPKRVSHFAADTTPDELTDALAVIVDGGLLLYDDNTDELCVRTLMRHDSIGDSPNMLKAAARAHGAIHSPTIRDHVTSQVPEPVRDLWTAGIIAIGPTALGDLLHPEKAGTRRAKPKGSRKPSAKGSPEPITEPLTEGFPEGFPEGLREGEVVNHEDRRSKIESSSSTKRSTKGSSERRGRSEPTADTPRTTKTTTEDRPTDTDDLLDRTWRLLADRHLAAQPAGSVGNRAGWLRRARTNCLAEHDHDARKLLADDPGLTAVDLAELLEPAGDIDDDPTGDKAAAAAHAETVRQIAAAERLEQQRATPEYQTWEARQLAVWDAEGRPAPDQFDYPAYPDQREART